MKTLEHDNHTYEIVADIPNKREEVEEVNESTINFAQYDLRLSNVKNFIINETVGKVKASNIGAIRPLLQALELGERSQEVFIVITMDNQNNVTGLFEVFKGTLDSSTAHPRDVFTRALMMNACGIICVHNHPGGSLKASQADVKVTEALENAGNMIGINMYDHIIVTPNYDLLSIMHGSVHYNER